ncbi:phage major capsid protein [Ornithinimicrobium sp. LYQ92]|uniref:phage major capsid protein n=1 Tax=Serinicoccus sp. LYQ92 TaxID=3378798 RepID=UPI0038535C9F
MNLKEQRQALVAKGLALIKGAAGDLSDSQVSELEEINRQVESLTEKIDAGQSTEKQKSAKALIDRIENLGMDNSATSSKGAGRIWAKSVADKLGESAGANGVKALLTGEVTTPSAVAVVTLPDNPVSVLDLVGRRELNEHTYSYLRQVLKTNNAGPVADGATKPTSVYSFEEVEDRARVIAHLSEPFPIRYAEDHASMMNVLETQMANGIVQAIENLIVNGTGQGEEWEGILTVDGTTQVAFAQDTLTTLRKARTTLESKGERVTAVAMNPNDLEELDMLREDGTAGGFLMDSGAYDRILGRGVSPVSSLVVPQGTAILGDWGTTGLLIRQGAHTLAATQAGDLFDTNRMKLRTEGRFGFEMLRPQALAVVDLLAD